MKRAGFWWQTMGFTKTHMVGVFYSETFLALAAIVCGALSFSLEGQARMEMLLLAVVLSMLCCAVLLASILSLMFFRWSAQEGEHS